MEPGAIPDSVLNFARARGSSGAAWLERLPDIIASHGREWGLLVHGPLPGCREAAWAGAATTSDGTEVVLKVAWPHPEAETEAAGLRFFAGRGAVRLLECDEADFVLLLERCRPGLDLWSLPTTRDADEVAAGVLERLWRPADSTAAGIGNLAATVEDWNAEYPVTRAAYPAGLVGEAAAMGPELAASGSGSGSVVVHGDFNPFNVLSAEREAWLAIDPKPLVGDRAYDLAQYLGNRVEEAEATGDPRAWLEERITWFGRRLGLDPSRIAAWAFVKAVGWNWGPRVAGLFKDVAEAAGR